VEAIEGADVVDEEVDEDGMAPVPLDGDDSRKLWYGEGSLGSVNWEMRVGEDKVKRTRAQVLK
jgi:hypothetical protein